VDLPRRQMLASLIVRSTIVTLLVMSLSGLILMTGTRETFVVFAVDESLSVGSTFRLEADDFVEAATEGRPNDQWAVLPFAAQPGEFRNSVNAVSGTPGDEMSRLGTNLQSAIEVAVAGIPAEFVPHVILLSDGNETFGDATWAIAERRVRVSTVPLATRTEPELQVSAVNVPTQVAVDSPFNVEVVVDANHDDEVVVEVFRGDYLIHSERRKISEGENRFQFSQQIDRATQFTARIVRPDAAHGALPNIFNDTLLDNNSASGLVHTAGKPRVLLVERVAEAAQALEWALTEEGIQVDVRPPQAVPDVLAELQDYDVVMLSNIPANDLNVKQMDVLRAFVREVGGGLIMLGGDESFGLGGYYKTVVEDVLPVRSDFEKEKEKPGLAMVLVIDKSSSMGGQKLELAKDAARGTVELLGDKDQIGVIAFDGMPYWVSEMTSASQKSVVIDRISAIELGGGTTLYPAMEEAFRALRSTSAKLKHVIILTDGHSTPGDFEGIAQDMAAMRITVSSVGLGEVDEPLLRRIAEIGNGRAYFCTDATSVPQVFAKETITASKSAINEDPFLPLLVRATPVLDGINMDDAPFLLGYVVTQPKPTSEVILVHPETQDPVLSWWRYGLGMSVAFTSDARNRWAADWLSWEGFNKFWAQIVRFCLKKSDSQGMAIDIQQDGEVAHIVVDAVNASGQFLNQATTRLTIADPQLRTESMLLRQTAPGRYEADVKMSETGAWNVQVTQTVAGETIHQQSRGVVVGYPDELRLRNTNTALLTSLAELSGGDYQPDPRSVFTPLATESAVSVVPLWPWLLSLAAVLFVLDVALRRLELSSIFGSEVHRAAIRS
jgi:Ca-activated chloride channel family protein